MEELIFHGSMLLVRACEPFLLLPQHLLAIVVFLVSSMAGPLRVWSSRVSCVLFLFSDLLRDQEVYFAVSRDVSVGLASGSEDVRDPGGEPMALYIQD